MFTLPARTDLISVPVRTRPAWKVPSIVNSWRASSVEGDGLVGRAERLVACLCWICTNAGPMRTGVRVAYHPQGVRPDGHLLRGGAGLRVLSITAHHLLSFRETVLRRPS